MVVLKLVLVLRNAETPLRWHQNKISKFLVHPTKHPNHNAHQIHIQRTEEDVSQGKETEKEPGAQ
jgi:hypothetical protein